MLIDIVFALLSKFANYEFTLYAISRVLFIGIVIVVVIEGYWWLDANTLLFKGHLK